MKQMIAHKFLDSLTYAMQKWRFSKTFLNLYLLKNFMNQRIKNQLFLTTINILSNFLVIKHKCHNELVHFLYIYMIPNSSYNLTRIKPS